MDSGDEEFDAIVNELLVHVFPAVPERSNAARTAAAAAARAAAAFAAVADAAEDTDDAEETDDTDGADDSDGTDDTHGSDYSDDTDDIFDQPLALEETSLIMRHEESRLSRGD